MPASSRADRLRGAYIYARFSTEHQHSIEEQVDRCMRWCRERNIPILGIYPDEAISGTKLSRQNYDRMMDDLRAGLADTVVIYDQSRLMRDVAGWFGARKALEAMGVRVCSATQEYVGGDINKPDTYMMEGIQSIFDTMHVLITKEKVTEKLHYMAKAGLHTGGRPALGYKTVPAGDGKQKRLVIDEQEAAVVRRIFEQYAAGSSYREIIDRLNADGLKTKAGKSFGNNSLHDLLKNPLYTGRVIYGSKVYRADGTRNTHAPEGANVIERQDESLRIVPQGIFDAVAAQMARNKQQKPGRPASAREYPLKGKIYCGECGSAMAVAASKIKGHTYYYYRCAAKDRTHACTGKPIRCDELEDQIAAQLRAILSTADIRTRALTLLRQETARINQTGLDRCARIQDDLRTINQKISRLIDAIEDGNYIPAMRDRLTALEQEKTTLETRLKTLQANAAVAALPERKLEALFAKLTTNTTPTALLSIITRVEVYNTHIKIYTTFDPTPNTPHPKTDQTDTPTELITSVGPPSGVPRLIISTSCMILMIQREAKR